MSEQIRIKQLSVNYGNKMVLKSISTTIHPGEITAIIGPSGCGKTTLLKCLNGMIKEEEAQMTGEILLGEDNISNQKREELCRKIGMVFQRPTPFPFSIYKNMTYALKYYGVRDKKELKKQVESKLRLAGLYEEVEQELHKNALHLSGGQQQRLCIARALTVEPEILLLDEPCSALDVKASRVIEDMLVSMKEKYTPIIVTHNIPQAKRIADHVIFLYEGRIVEEGSVTEIFEQPKMQETKDFLAGVFG